MLRLVQLGDRHTGHAVERNGDWEYYQDIGFVHYWWRQDYVQAGEWFTRASTFPGAPFWLTTIAATTLAENYVGLPFE